MKQDLLTLFLGFLIGISVAYYDASRQLEELGDAIQRLKTEISIIKGE